MKQLAVRNAPLRQSPRRGAIIVFAILALTVVSMLGAALLKTVSQSKQQLQREEQVRKEIEVQFNQPMPNEQALQLKRRLIGHSHAGCQCSSL